LHAVLASLATVAFQPTINWLYALCSKSAAAGTSGRFLAIIAAVILVSSLIVIALLHLAPSAVGSGIPQVKLTYWKEFGHAARRIAAIKFSAGIINFGGEQSLGYNN
jgi:CIC family chloride channel protein